MGEAQPRAPSRHSQGILQLADEGRGTILFFYARLQHSPHACYDPDMKREFVHFLGIGGIGVSALARFFRSRGAQVTGSDIARSEITDELKKEGFRIFIGEHSRTHIRKNVTRLITTSAAGAHNPEILEARQRGIPVENYARALARVTQNFFVISVAGAHGKSTTTAMTALALMQGGLDPTVIVGTKLKEFKNSNFRKGSSKYFVHEADEYRASFLNYRPDIALVSNIDHEHLDYYKTIAAVENAFLKFLLNIRPGGTTVLNRVDTRLRKIAVRLGKERPDIRVRWYSLADKEAARIKKVLKVPGDHNVSNALAAYRVGQSLGVPRSKILHALAAYRGAWRRFDYQGIFHGAKVFADYAHHPTEIRATLEATREKFPTEKIWCVFQPHHYERTRDLFKEFVSAFDGCDELILLDIYEVAGRERKRGGRETNSGELARAISRRGIRARYLSKAENLARLLSENLTKGDILLMMGAGTIWEMTKKLMRHTGG